MRPVIKPKRKRGGGLDAADSEDSDFDDLRGIHGATAAARDAAKSVRSDSLKHCACFKHIQFSGIWRNPGTGLLACNLSTVCRA